MWLPPDGVGRRLGRRIVHLRPRFHRGSTAIAGEGGWVVTDPAPTVGDRLLAAGLTPARIALHAAAGTLMVDGRPAHPDDPAPPPARIVIAGQ